MVDIHSHILDSIDDGAKSLEETIEMLENAAKNGTRKIFATPHYCIGYGEEPYNGVLKRVENLNREIEKRNINIKIYPGQEVYYSTRLLEDLQEGIIGTLNEGRYMLIEFNMRELEEDVFETLYELKIKKIVPIIAHPERYIYIQKHPSLINKFIDEGCLFQLNGGSILGMHGADVEKVSKEFIEKGIYSFIGSDAHSTRFRKTGIKKALEKVKEINEGLEKEIELNGEKLILNEEIYFNGEKIEKRKKRRGIFSFFKR
ncbi:MAG: tyrosine-protein phosphatase [Clostridium sp.]